MLNVGLTPNWRQRAIAAGAFAMAVSGTAVAQSGTYSDVAYLNPPFANNRAIAMTTGPDGAMWYTDTYNGIVRVTTNGVFSQFPVPTPNSSPNGITPGPDGALWFTEGGGNKIGRITTQGQITEYPLAPWGDMGNGPTGICAGPDGALWFGQAYHDTIGRITTEGVVTQYPTASDGGTTSITVGSDGALWFPSLNTIQRMTTSGAVTLYQVPTLDSLPSQIVAGPDGALWFTEYGADKIGRLTTSGVFTEYPIVTTLDSEPSAIATGADGALWFTMNFGSGLWRITTLGSMSEFPAAIGGYIAPGPDGALWFTGTNDQSIGHAPTCDPGFSAAFSDGILTMNFVLGTDFPSDLSVLLHTSTGVSEVFNKKIGPVVPPDTFALTNTSSANLGPVRVQAVVTAESGQVACSAWNRVETDSP